MTGSRIAWAVVEAIHEDNRCRCLFATHYHELTRLAETLRRARRSTMSARANGRAIWCCSTKSPKGRPIAATASPSRGWRGCRQPVLARAKAVLAKLEAGRAEDRRARGGARRPAAVRRRRASTRKSRCDPLARASSHALDVDALSPREALDMLYELKREAGED